MDNIYFDFIREKVCKNNDSAYDFCVKFHLFFHSVDDLVDEAHNEMDILNSFLNSMDVYNHPFFIAYRENLLPQFIIAHSTYNLHIKWSKDSSQWKRMYADFLRSSGINILIIVATICGGSQHANTITEEIYERSYLEHHTKEGTAI